MGKLIVLFCFLSLALFVGGCVSDLTKNREVNESSEEYDKTIPVPIDAENKSEKGPWLYLTEYDKRLGDNIYSGLYEGENYIFANLIILKPTPCHSIKPSVNTAGNNFDFSFEFISDESSDCMKTIKKEKIHLMYGPLPDGEYGVSAKGIDKIISIPNIYYCKRYDDCMKIQGDCCGCSAGGEDTAINKQYKNLWNEKVGECTCPAIMSDHWTCSEYNQPKCINKTCILVMDDYAVCENQNGLLNKDKCYYNLAVKNNDTTICDLINKENMSINFSRFSCKKEIIGDNICGNGGCENDEISLEEGDGKNVYNHTFFLEGTDTATTGVMTIDEIRKSIKERNFYTINNIDIFIKDIYHSSKGVRSSMTLTIGENNMSCPQDCNSESF